MNKKESYGKRALIHKKFVTGNILAVSLSCCLIYLACSIAMSELHYFYFIILIDAPMLLIVWHKAYQILYDLKLLLLFNKGFDTKINYPPEKELPEIAFIIPSCQEPFNVAKMTFDSVVNCTYNGRKQIIVVDNSRDTIAKDFVEWKSYVESFNLAYSDRNITASFFYNEEKGTLKPGNLDMGQRFIDVAELVVFLDVDSTLPADKNLLERAAAEFEEDNKLGFLQFKIKATNNHFNSLTQAIAANQDLLRLRMISRGYGGYKIFEGHNGIWRKKVLDEVGAWTDYFRGDIIITEDILKSVVAYSIGYYGKSINIETGEWVPSSLKALESMWMRWMYGNSQVFFKYVKKIYSKQTSLIEKFDISYHMLHHLVTLCFFLLTFYFQLFIHGEAANVFIILTFVLPQTIGAVTAYYTSVGKTNLTFIKKIQCLYSGFFLVDSFIMFTQIKSDLKFLARIKQGWRVTEKGIENSTIGWVDIVRSESFHIALAFLCVAVGGFSWIINYHMTFYSLLYHLALIFISVNVLVCIVVFGKKERRLHNKVESVIMNEDLSDGEIKSRNGMDAFVLFGNTKNIRKM